MGPLALRCCHRRLVSPAAPKAFNCRHMPALVALLSCNKQSVLDYPYSLVAAGTSCAIMPNLTPACLLFADSGLEQLAHLA